MTRDKALWLVAEMIIRIGPEGKPSGHLYVELLDQVSLAQYDLLLNTVKDMGCVTESGHYLTLTTRGHTKLYELVELLKKPTAS